MNESKDCKFDYERYLKSLKETGEPILLEDMPPYTYDMLGISKYAKEKGVTVPELSDEEKEMFKIHRKKD